MTIVQLKNQLYFDEDVISIYREKESISHSSISAYAFAKNSPIENSLLNEREKEISSLLRQCKSRGSEKNNIISFLRSHPELIEVLIEGIDVVRSIAAPSEVILRYFEDIEEGRDKILLSFKCDIDVDAELDIEDKIFDSWYGDLKPDIMMMFNYEVV